MDKIKEAKILLKMLGAPEAQQADICCHALLAMAGVTKDTAWLEAENEWICIHDIIEFANTHYGTTYAKESEETFYQQVMRPFQKSMLIEDNGEIANTPDYKCRIREERMLIITAFQSYHKSDMRKRVSKYYEKLITIYNQKKKDDEDSDTDPEKDEQK